MPVFESRVTIECPRERVFDFLLRPANVALISPPEMGLSFVSAPEIVQLGSRIEFKIQGYGTVQTMVHEITGLKHPEHITETQVQGLFGQWIHEHGFEMNSRGHAVVIDRIEFEPPGGFIGLLVTPAKIQEQLEDAFAHRHEQLQKYLTGSV